MTTVTATARDAGRNVVHEVKVSDARKIYGNPVRRSAHRYNYAICHWAMVDGYKAVIVDRWSRNPKCLSRQFAVKVESI